MIRAADLTLVLEGHTILDHVSFAVDAGECVALVGPNGSGKTSVLRCLLGLVPFSGRISIDGFDAVREPIESRMRMAYVPQRAAFGDALAVEVLGFVARLRRIDRRRVPEVLRTVGLEAHARERVRTFSGGMQQRLSLAAALLADTPILLLDEPTASLDRQGQEVFLDLMLGLRRAGRTIVLASHRAEEVQHLADRVLELADGRLVECAAVATAMVPGGGRVIPIASRMAGR
jgi:ABC-type multidrug transport system ATPase subunit